MTLNAFSTFIPATAPRIRLHGSTSIKRQLKRRSAIEPTIGYMKAEGHLGRCYLKGRADDAANAILSAIGYFAASSPG